MTSSTETFPAKETVVLVVGELIPLLLLLFTMTHFMPVNTFPMTNLKVVKQPFAFCTCELMLSFPLFHRDQTDTPNRWRAISDRGRSLDDEPRVLSHKVVHFGNLGVVEPTLLSKVGSTKVRY